MYCSNRYSFDNYLLYCDDAVRAALRQLPIDATVKIISEVPFFKRMKTESLVRLAEVLLHTIMLTREREREMMMLLMMGVIMLMNLSFFVFVFSSP